MVTLHAEFHERVRGTSGGSRRNRSSCLERLQCGCRVRLDRAVWKLLVVCSSVCATSDPLHGQEEPAPEIAWERTIPFEPLEPQFGGCRMELIVRPRADADPYPSVAPTPDGGYLLSGEYYEGRRDDIPDLCNVFWHYAFLRKYDTEWTLLWTAYIAESNREKIGRGAPTSDGGAVIAGSTYTPDFRNWAHFIARFDARGGRQWFRVLTRFVRREVRWVTAPVETSDGGFAYCALEIEVGGPVEEGTWWFFRTESSGELRWKMALEDLIGGENRRVAVREAPDGGFLILFHRRRPPDSPGTVLARTDSSGERVWTRVISEIPVCGDAAPGEPFSS